MGEGESRGEPFDVRDELVVGLLDALDMVRPCFNYRHSN